MNKFVSRIIALIPAVFILATANAQPPEDWTVEPALYQYTMTFTTQLKMNGKISDDPDDAVAAFVGDECRGVAHPSDSISSKYPNLAFLMVYSNAIEGDTVNFKLYDADEDSIIAMSHRALFKPNAAYGLPSRPLKNLTEQNLIAFNFFTPNNDGHNDFWKIKNADIYIDFELTIYDINGQKVFNENRLYRNDWDGTHNGKKLPEGVYYYTLKDPDGNMAYTGTISLAR